MKESIISQRIPYSQIRVMSDAAQKMESEGRKVIHLEIGRPDFTTPDNIVNAAIDALKAGKVHYSANAGIPELRKAIARKYQERYQLSYDYAKEVIVTNGVAEGIYLAMGALLDPGDQVLIPDPAWINYEIVPLLNLAEPVSYSLKKENNFLPDAAELEKLITPRTKMIFIVNPSNPTGMVIPAEILKELGELAVKHDLVIVSDEIYEDIVYAPASFTCMATLEALKERTIVLNGFSKSYSMTGWRMGYALGPAEYINAMLRLHQYTLTSTNTFAQWGALEAVSGTQQPVADMLKEFEARKEYIYNELNGIEGLSCVKPQGAFYLFVSVRELGLTGFEAAHRLLQDYGVVTVPGESFGANGAGYIRLSYASSMENLKAAAALIREFVENV
ncbi:pyridoxal phosphate-dependent aminotransferase [Bacilliculturomica massiliensis]|uniref:pyridoxal phosphate-dependent aminotransferase n=1 Tax=Bacilliculturomica massiliensis TaxID=1917867 RepID=UPI0013EF1A30|nr:pyridoxal phosphate-dependent aminotransferase [Bacilliculturomica massiliensis]